MKLEQKSKEAMPNLLQCISIRDEEGNKAAEAWMSCKDKRGTLEIATGVGKTRIGLNIAAALAWSMMEHLKQPSILILTPTENLRDIQWEDEAKKWDMEFLFKDKVVTTACIQSAYRWLNLTYDLVICDEIHTMLSPEYSKFFKNNKLKRILGLSATIPIDKRPILDTIAPIVYTINPSEAKDKNLISQYKVFNVALEFTPKEALQYNTSNGNVVQAEQEIMSACNISLDKVFDKAMSALKNWREPSSVRMWSSRYLQGIRTRLSVCNNAENKVHATCQILSKLNRDKALIFSESIKFAETIRKACKTAGCETYHSKMKDDIRKEILIKFNDPDSSIKALSTVKALDMGLNVENVSLSVIAAGTSKPLQFTQRLGRNVRRTTDDKIAIIVNLYIKDTKEERRVQSRIVNEPNSTWLSLEAFLNRF